MVFKLMEMLSVMKKMLQLAICRTTCTWCSSFWKEARFLRFRLRSRCRRKRPGGNLQYTIFKHSKYIIFQPRCNCSIVHFDQHQQSPNQYSHYQEKLSRRPLGLGVLALPEDHPQRHQAKQPSQVFSSWGFCW